MNTKEACDHISEFITAGEAAHPNYKLWGIYYQDDNTLRMPLYVIPAENLKTVDMNALLAVLGHNTKGFNSAAAKKLYSPSWRELLERRTTYTPGSETYSSSSTQQDHPHN